MQEHRSPQTEWIIALLTAACLIFVLARCEVAAAKIPRATLYSPPRVLASVRVGKYGGCSATIILKHGKHAWGLSAAHCANSVGTEFTFGNPDGSEGRGRWIAIDRDHDLSLFICWSESVLGVAPVPCHQTPDWTLASEAIGYTRRQGPKWKQIKPHGLRTISSSNGRFRRMMFAPTFGPFAGGDSGGGVFYAGDWLVGVMTHGEDNRDIYAATLPQIKAFLKAHRSLFLGADPFG